MRRFAFSPAVALVFVGISLAGVSAAGITDMKKGEGGSEVSGAAGPSGSQGQASDLAQCDKPMGAIAVVEPDGFVNVDTSKGGGWVKKVFVTH